MNACRLSTTVMLLVVLLLGSWVTFSLADGWRATDSAVEWGYSQSDFPGNDNPDNEWWWYAPEPSWHDMWWYDYDGRGKGDWVLDYYMKWSDLGVQTFRRDDWNLVHELRVSHRVYEADVAGIR